MEALSTIQDKATELVGQASDAIDAVKTNPQVVAAYEAAYPIASKFTSDEWAVFVITFLPLFFVSIEIIKKVFCCCCQGKKPGKVAPASTPPTGKKSGAPAMLADTKADLRKSVLVRNTKDAPEGSIGHGTRGVAAKNNPPPKKAAAEKKPAGGGKPGTPAGAGKQKQGKKSMV